MDGFFVCAALETHYVVCNVATGVSQDLFPIEPDTNPVMIRIAKVIFLIAHRSDSYNNKQCFIEFDFDFFLKSKHHF
jgi:hypothetical protein